MSVQCILWDAARYPEFISETGCPNALPWFIFCRWSTYAEAIGTIL
jgi:hypothetical protein